MLMDLQPLKRSQLTRTIIVDFRSGNLHSGRGLRASNHSTFPLVLKNFLSQCGLKERQDRKSTMETSPSRRQFLNTTKSLGLGLGSAPLWTGMDLALAEEKEEKEKPSTMNTMNTGLVSDLRYLEHTQGGTHPESPARLRACLLYTSPSPRDRTRSRMPSSA